MSVPAVAAAVQQQIKYFSLSFITCNSDPQNRSQPG